jgi:hypothetical protein
MRPDLFVDVDELMSRFLSLRNTSSLQPVTHTGVAPDTIRHIILPPCMTYNAAHHLSMTTQAVVFHNGSVLRTDSDGFFEILQRERAGMMKSILRLGHVFAEKIMRRVTVVADGHSVMRSLDPSVIVTLHHMTIGTHSRIVGDVRQTMGIEERVPAQPSTHTQTGHGNQHETSGNTQSFQPFL